LTSCMWDVVLELHEEFWDLKVCWIIRNDLGTYRMDYGLWIHNSQVEGTMN
jgi:hypothetical protein